MKRIRVLALASYPVEAASSRYRIVQFIEPLARRGIDVTFSPFLDAPLFDALYKPGKLFRRLPRLFLRTAARLGAVVAATRADVVFVQRDAMLFGPPVIEWLIARVLRKRMIVDLDDANWIAYPSPVYGRLATWLKWPSKTDRLIGWADAVTCGSPNIAGYANGILVPTVVDTKRFHPAPHRDTAIPTVGWVGTHSTYAYLQRLLPLFERLASEVPFRLRIVGSGRAKIEVRGVDVEMQPWSLAREVEDFQALDVGVYPIADDAWSAGKAGFKAVQYMATGVPFVMSPVGVCASMGIEGRTHLLARSDDEWHDALLRLIRDVELRESLSKEGRVFAEAHYDIEQQADALAEVISG
ncbi:MAG TPA: glycosyltransferase family 4 protein [Thermoanaerobaculia bacterium]|jgi:glycosyltransferase involved in cell wall biosynthesis|nr:glycosyltransferase family 4 protein [Thermoanaerobaculia bacterium]